MKALVLLLVSSIGFSAPIPFKLRAPEVEFLAIGRPSALKIKGEFEGDALTGELKVADSELRGKIQVPLDKFDTGIGLRNRHMREKYLETEKYPFASLTKIQCPLAHGLSPEKQTVSCSGEMELHGQTKPLALEMDLEKDGEEYELEARFSLSLKEYGIQVPSFMGITVADRVEVVAKVLLRQ